MPTQTPNYPTKKLGKRAYRHDPRTLKLAKYLTPALPPPPTRAGYIDKVRDWPMYQNDQIGDCVLAASGHMIEQWTVYAGKPFVPPENAIVQAYSDITGYVPGDPETDNGTVMLDALKYWRKQGIAGHKIGAYVLVNPRNATEMSQAVYLFGNLYIGLNLPISAQDSTSVWEVPRTGLAGDGSPGSWGGHCVPIVGYSRAAAKAGTAVVTWGQTMAMTWNFVHSYADEVWAILSTDWINDSGKAPSGLDYAALVADLAAITG